MKMKRLIMALIALAIHGGLCMAQEQAPTAQVEAQNGQMLKLKDVKMARMGKQWFKVETNVNCHTQYEPLLKMITRTLFGKEKENISVTDAIEKHMAEYEEVVDPKDLNKKVEQFEQISVEFRGGNEQKYLNYHVGTMKLTLEGKESVTKNRERSFVYDVVHGKILSLADVFLPEVVTRVKKQTENLPIQIVMNEMTISIACKKNGEWMKNDFVYHQNMDLFTDKFKELVNWDEVAKRKERMGNFRPGFNPFMPR